MTRLAEVKLQAGRSLAAGDTQLALRLYDAIVQGAPFDADARVKVADCLAVLGAKRGAIEVYRAVGWYAIKSGHPLLTVVVMRVLQSLGAEADDLAASLVAHYGSESELLGKSAARIAAPEADTSITVPDLDKPVNDQFFQLAAQRAAQCLKDFDQYPEALHPIPLLSDLSESAFRKILAAIIVRRLPDGEHVIRQGETGYSLFFVAAGQLRVYATDGMSRIQELARLHENAVLGEMALIRTEPRSASVEVIGDADVLEVSRDMLTSLAGELQQVAVALGRFTRTRMLRNLMASSPLFRPFNKSQQQELLRRFTSHDVPQGTDIIHQDEEGQGLFIIVSGEVSVTKTGQDGAVTPLATLRAGDVFGEMALIRGETTAATVTSSEATSLLFLGREYVDRIVAGVPEVRNYLEALTGDRQLDIQLALGNDEDEDDGSVIILL